MGLMKTEVVEATQSAVLYPRFYNSDEERKYSTSSEERGGNESQVEDDSEVLQVLAKQRLQVYEATLALSEMEHQAEAKLNAGGAGSKRLTVPLPPASRLSVNTGSSMSSISGDGQEDSAARLSFEQILKLLRSSVDGEFQSAVPRLKCASPVPYNASTEGYEPLFYVSKEPRSSKNDDRVEGIPVRYQGFTKSTVWFSKETPCWGLAARRMQHQSRIKQKGAKAVVTSIACKAALFFHYFEGFSYVLIHRSNPEEEVVKANMVQYIVERAAKMVQVWSVPNSRASASSSSSSSGLQIGASSSLQIGDKSMGADEQSHSLSTSLDPNLMRLKLEKQRQQSSKRSFSRCTSSDPNDLESPKRLHSSDDFKWEGVEDGAFFSDSRFDLPDFSSRTTEAAASGYSTGAQNFAIGEDNSTTNYLLDPCDGFECDALLEEALLSGDEDYASASGTSGETNLQDFLLDESDDGFGNSHDPNGVVLCDIIYKTFCERMDQSQFARCYDRVQRLLFNRAFGQSLRAAMDNKDPRVSVEFMFPASASGENSFCKNRPVGKLECVERAPGSSDFVAEWSDECVQNILGTNPAGESDVLDKMDQNDMSFIMSKFYLLEHFNPDQTQEFWFQRIITRKDGEQVVIRGFSSTEVGGDGARGSRTVQLQDVTHLYADLLTLPPASSL